MTHLWMKIPSNSFEMPTSHQVKQQVGGFSVRNEKSMSCSLVFKMHSTNGRYYLQCICLLPHPKLSVSCPDSVGVIDGFSEVTSQLLTTFENNEWLAVIDAWEDVVMVKPLLPAAPLEPNSINKASRNPLLVVVTVCVFWSILKTEDV